MKKDDMYQLLLKSVKAGTITAVREAASQIFGSAVSVTDNSFRVLSADKDPGSTDDMLEQSGDDLYVSQELLDLFIEHDLTSSLTARPHETIVVDWGYFSEHPHITTGIFWHGNILGSITVLVDSAEYDPDQDEALQACADALAIVMHDSAHVRKDLRSDRDRFISRLFRGSASRNDLTHAINNRFFKSYDRYFVLATQFTPDRVLQETIDKSSRILLYQNEGITYYMADAESRELKVVEEWIENRRHIYGLSYVFGDPLLAGKMARQAEAVLQFGSHSPDKKTAWSFPEYALLLLVNATNDASDFMHPGILEMEQYDLENNTQYLETLREWLLHRMDYSATAGAMNLHRNSLYYRMQRISELFGIDINDMNTDVQLYLTLCSDKQPHPGW